MTRVQLLTARFSTNDRKKGSTTGLSVASALGIYDPRVLAINRYGDDADELIGRICRMLDGSSQSVGMGGRDN